jgi:hypothetical protein
MAGCCWCDNKVPNMKFFFKKENMRNMAGTPTIAGGIVGDADNRRIVKQQISPISIFKSPLASGISDRRTRHRLCIATIHLRIFGFRQLPFRPYVVASITMLVFLKVILVFFFCIPKITGRHYFRYNRPRPDAGCIHFADQFLRGFPLIFAEIKDSRAVRRAHIISLPVPGGRIVDLEEKF